MVLRLKERLLWEQTAAIDVWDGEITVSGIAMDHNGQMNLHHVGWGSYDTSADDEEIASEIRKLWHASGLSTCSVCSCLRSESLVMKQFRLPHLNEAELGSALRLEAEQALRLPPRDIALDWHLHRDRGEDESEAHGSCGLLVAVPRSDLQSHLRLLSMAGLYPVVVDVSALAVANLFLLLDAADHAQLPVCILNLSRRAADFIVIGSDGAVFPRFLVSHSGSWDERADYLVENVRDLFRYWEHAVRGVPIKEILMTGTISDSGGLAEEIAKKTGGLVRTWDPLERGQIKAVGRARRARFQSYPSASLATALGLALRGHGNAGL